MTSKRVLAGISILLVLVTLAACGGGGGGSSPPPASSAPGNTWDSMVWDQGNWG
jgi:predicted small lipoprotein YifL